MAKARVEPETIEIPAANDLDKLRKYHAELGEIIAKLETDKNGFEKVSYHVRRHFPLYALAAIFALVVVLIPTRNSNDKTSNASNITDSSDTSGSSGPSSSGGPDLAGTDNSGSGVATSDTGGVANTADTSKPVPHIVIYSGKTRAGVTCAQGVRQIPFSAYAAPCVSAFSGNNGGATFRGVTDKTIKIVIRATSDSNGANAKAVDQVNAQSGRATRSQALALLKKWDAGYFSKMFDLYGRKVVFEQFTSKTSNGTDEAQSKGKEGACADATDIIKNNKAFMVLGYGTDFQVSQPFADCAVEKGGVMVPLAAAYFPESWFTQKWAPYAWNLTMECEQISTDVAEYIGKRLLNRKARWAESPVYQKQNRKFGTYVPDNDGYQHCTDLTRAKLKKDYNYTPAAQYNYQLDVSRFPDQAAQAVPKFQAAGVTTLINACDTLSTTFLTQQARAQGWGPEWLLIGVALQDRAGNARLFDQTRVAGHMFGMSQLGKTSSIYGSSGEAYKAWKAAFPKDSMPNGYADVYFELMHVYNMLQNAGPVLTPNNIAKGMKAAPLGGGAHGAFGTWGYRDGDHTAIDDSREIYWVCQNPNSAGQCAGPPADDHGKGEFLETNGGQRYGSGQWPKEEPKVYPKGPNG